MRKKHTHFTFHISHFMHVSTTDCVGLFATAIISPRQSSNIRYLSLQSKDIATKAINKAKLRYYKYFVIKMNTTHSQIVSFIWSIADDVLREWSKNDNPPIAHRRNHPAYRRSQRWTLASDTNVQKAIRGLL